MRIIRNERLVRTRRAIGRYVPWMALVALFISLITSFARPERLGVMLASVVLGLALSLVGGQFAERYTGPVAHHEALAKALKGLDDRHLLAQYALPASHVLLDPSGCTVFVVKSQAGQITYEDGRWNHRQRGKGFRRLAGQLSVGVPHVEADQEVHKLQEWLRRQLTDVQVPIQAAIVFVNPKVTVYAAQSPVPAFYGKKVRAWLRGPGLRKRLPAGQYRRLAAAFNASIEGSR